MPRRTKDESVTDSVDASTALAAQEAAAQTDNEASAAAGSEQAAKTEKAEKPQPPLGPTTTRTGAEALVIPSPKGTRTFTAGGDKGGKIAELLKTKPEMSRKDIAALVGCSQSRVAEVARVLGLARGRTAPPTSTDNQAESQTVPEAVNA